MHDAIFLAEVFEKSTDILAKALVASQISDIRPSSFFFSTFHTQAPSINNLVKFNQCMIKVKTGLKDMTTKIGNIKNMLKRIFLPVSGGGQINHGLAASTDNNNKISL